MKRHAARPTAFGFSLLLGLGLGCQADPVDLGAGPVRSGAADNANTPAGARSARPRDTYADVQIIVEPGDSGAAFLGAVQGAKQSIHLAMYYLSWRELIDALIAQRAAGLEVKVMLNQRFPNALSNQNTFDQLTNGGVEVAWAPSQFRFSHEKYAVLDGSEAWIMTMNSSFSALTNNREYLAVDHDAADIDEAQRIFAADFDGSEAAVDGALVVSPVNSRRKMVDLVSSAQSTVDIEMEELTDPNVADTLAQIAGHAHVRLVLSSLRPAQIERDAVTKLQNAGVEVVTLAKPYIHAKSIVVDGTTAYIGSENFTAGSLDNNREMGLLFTTPSEVQKIISTTQEDFAAGTTFQP